MITIIMPTLNRTAFLGRALEYYHRAGFDGWLAIGDSSDLPQAEVAAGLIEKYRGLGLKILYEYMPRDRYPNNILCCRRLMEMVTTPYVTFIGDDDLQLPSAMKRCMDFLEANPEYVGARGHRLEVFLGEPVPYGTIIGASVAQFPNYDIPSAAQRWLNYVGLALSVELGVFRSELWRRAYLPSSTPAMYYFSGEFRVNSLYVIAGRIKQFSFVGSVMQVDIAPGGTGGGFHKTSIFDLIRSPDWPVVIADLRQEIVTLLGEMDGLPAPEAGALFDRAMWTHVSMLLAYYCRIWHGGLKPSLTSSPELLASIRNNPEFKLIQDVLANGPAA